MCDLLFPVKNQKRKSCNVMFPHILQHLAGKTIDDLRCEQQQAIEAIYYENKGLQGEIPVKDQEIRRRIGKE